ncbi:MAG: hypothetical protein ABS942_12605 [Solibacillus sp.]
MLTDLMKLATPIHNYIILDMTLKTLERDRQYISQLKMAPVFDQWYDMQSKRVFEDMKANRDLLYKAGCKVEKTGADDLVTEYTILFRGHSEVRRYSNIAIRNGVMEETKRLLGIEYRKPEQ